MIPRNRPRIERKDTEKLIASRRVSDPVCLVGIRGYYRDSMGARGKNDRSIYDDAIILVSPNVHAAFNANVDPGAYGKNPKIGKGYASLKPGVYRYKLGRHGIRSGNPYRALVQGNPVTVSRDGGEDETGYFGINIHKGSNRSVSSEGCQTIPPAQWPAFITMVETEMRRNNAKTLSYVLTSAN